MYYLNRDHRALIFAVDCGENTEAELDAYLRELDALVSDYQRRGTRAVLVADTRFVARTPPANLRAKLGRWLTSHSAGIRQVVVGAVFIIESSLMRGALTALGWVGVLPPNLVVVARFEDAIARAQIMLSSEQIPFPKELEGSDAERRLLGPLYDTAVRSLKRTTA